nr:MAG TPA: hypothetical protein [Bacteriophage sp.]
MLIADTIHFMQIIAAKECSLPVGSLSRYSSRFCRILDITQLKLWKTR